MKILVTGKNGQVGNALCERLAEAAQVIPVGREDIDLTDFESLHKLVDHIKPDLIINAAAYTAVDKAESNASAAFEMNSALPKFLAAQANLLNIPLIHYSTDYVFDGGKDGAYFETDSPNPKSVYGFSKWMGENNVRAVCAKHLIIRTEWVYGFHGNNFLKTIMRLANERSEMKVVDDQWGAPTGAELIAEITLSFVRQIQSQLFDRYGIYHLAAKGHVTWHGYAVKILRMMNSAGIETMLRPENIYPVSTEGYPLPAVRPKNSMLNTDKLRVTLDVDLPNWEVGVESCVENLIKSNKL